MTKDKLTRDEKISAHATPADYPVLGVFGASPQVTDEQIHEMARPFSSYNVASGSREFDYQGFARAILALSAPPAAETRHSDDITVDEFAAVMKAKLADARAKGRSGWEECDPVQLSIYLREHVEKGDPRDVANFCMMLWHHEAPISDAALPMGRRAITRLDDEVIKNLGILNSHTYNNGDVGNWQFTTGGLKCLVRDILLAATNQEAKPVAAEQPFYYEKERTDAYANGVRDERARQEKAASEAEPVAWSIVTPLYKEPIKTVYSASDAANYHPQNVEPLYKIAPNLIAVRNSAFEEAASYFGAPPQSEKQWFGSFVAETLRSIALAAAPQEKAPASEDAKDAARYRWWCETGNDISSSHTIGGKATIDAAIDAGMQSQPQ